MSTTTPPAGKPGASAGALDAAVRARYSEGATRPVSELCCPVDYDPDLLAAIPEAVVARDYGCGNPTRHVAPGETVLDLGSGTGKICFIAAQVVGAEGRVLGVDMNDDMLAVAREAAPVVAERVGYANVTFHKARIEDLALDREALDRWLADHPVRGEADLSILERRMATMRATPMIASDGVDVVVSNCVLNLVMPDAKRRLFDELFRVLKRGGRAVISDIVSDETPPEHMLRDPELWSGCISGAFREDQFLRAFEEAGFHGVEIVERGDAPWRVVEGIEFRSVTVRAYKGKQGPCLEQGHAVVYKGPWKRVEDDDGHTFERGRPMAVCGKTYHLMTSGPYADGVIGLEPPEPIAEEDAAPFPCTGMRVRTPAETKGGPLRQAISAEDCCEPGTCC